MLRNYTERLGSRLEFPSQRRKFFEDVVRLVSAAPETRSEAPKMAGRSNDEILASLDNHDPITRDRNVDSLMDVYVDRTYRTFLESANPSPESAREQVAGLIEGLSGATRVVRGLGGSGSHWSSDQSFVRDLMTGAALKPMQDAVTPQEASDTGLDALQRNSDPSGSAMQRFLDDNNLTHVSDASILKMSKKVWPLWQKIGELARQEPRISVPDFTTNPGKFQKQQLVSVKVDNAANQALKGNLIRKGAQMAYKARASQGKQVRKLIILADALGVLGGSVMGSQEFLNRDDNLARSLSSSSFVRRLFPRGSPYQKSGLLKEVTEQLLALERDARIMQAEPLKKFTSRDQYRVVIREASKGDIKMRQTVFDEPEIETSVAKNISQKRRGRTASYDIGVPDPKRSKTKPVDPRQRPLGVAAGADRLRITREVSVQQKLPNAGQILRNVRASNPNSILNANQALTSSSVPESNAVDSVAAGMQSELVRNQRLGGPDDRVRLKSSCVQIANSKSILELSRKTQLLDTATKRVDLLSKQLVSERSVSEEKLKKIKQDNNALERNNEEANARFEDAVSKAKEVKRKYDVQCERWREIKFQNDQLATKLSSSKKQEALVRREHQARVQLLQEQLKNVNQTSEKFGREKETHQEQVTALEERVKLAQSDLERAVSQFGRDKSTLQERMKRLQDENYELAEANEAMISEQLSLRQELEQANGYCREARRQLEQVGVDNMETDRTILELREKINQMEFELERSHTVSLTKDLELLSKGQEAKVITGQWERQLNMNGRLMWENQNLERSLLSSEEEVNRSRDQCPFKVEIEDVEMVETGGKGGGRKGGGYGGEPPGASMRPLPEWMEREETALDYGDEPYKPAPEFTVAGEGGDSGAMWLGLLLVLIVAVYMGYR